MNQPGNTRSLCLKLNASGKDRLKIQPSILS